MLLAFELPSKAKEAFAGLLQIEEVCRLTDPSIWWL